MALKLDAPANNQRVNDFSSDELSTAIENLRSGGFEDMDIAFNILPNLEWLAISVLKTASNIYPYAPDKTLTKNENAQENFTYERNAWLNEAFHLQDHPCTQIATAAKAMIKIENARNHAVNGEPEKTFFNIFQAAMCLSTGKEHALIDNVEAGNRKIKAMQPAAKTGERVINGFVKAGIARGKQQTSDRQSDWQSWRDEAARIKESCPNIKSKNAIAKRIKINLSLSESVETIRNRIKNTW